MKTSDYIFKTCKLLVDYFKLAIEYNESSFHTRIFVHVLHPQEKFLFSGESINIKDTTITYLEHVVPCVVLGDEVIRLIKENKLSNDEIATLLQKHWKVARITKEEQKYLDLKKNLNLKSSMPKGWNFEEGDTFARFKLGKIILK